MFRVSPPTPQSTVFWPRQRSTHCRSTWRARVAWIRRDTWRRGIPNTRLVIDHLGLPQAHEPPPPAEPFADLPHLLALAAHDNIAVKISGACTLSHEPFPYKDIWDPLFRIFDAFGFDRCMWGTDWTRAVGLLTYKQGVDAFRVTDRLSDSDRATLMGETLARVYNWSPSKV